MATITTRSGKGSPLTNSEVDSNFSNINTELSQKESASNKGVANGYASLDGSGKVPSTQLPSYVDDVVEGANLAALPATGETGKIYVTLDTNKTYRWSGSAYVEISASPGSTDAVTEGSTNLYFTNARARSAISASGSLSYNSSTGVLSYTQPTNVSALTNDSGYITSSALSPYLTSATAAGTYQTTLVSGTSIKTVNGQSVLGSGNIQIDGGVTSFNTRTGAVTLSSGDVTTALGFTPYNSTNPSGYISGITSGMVTTALGYTPYNSTNPSGYITSSASITGNAAGITGYTLEADTASASSIMTRNASGDSSIGSRFHFRTASAYNAPGYALIGMNWGGAAGTYRNFAVYDYVNSRPMFESFGETRNFTVHGALSAVGATLTSASTVSVSTWEKWTLETTGVTAKARQGSDTNGLNFTSNARWTGSAWAEDDTARKKFAYIQHLGSGRHEFRTSPTGAGVSWTTSLTVDESAVNSTVALQQGGNQVLHAGNYTSYSPSLTGSGASGTWSINVTGNANSASTLASGAATTGPAYFRKSQTDGSYTTAALWTESFSNTTTGIAFHISGVVGKFLEMRTNGTLYWNGDTMLHSGNYSSYALPVSGGTVTGHTNFNVGVTVNSASPDGYGINLYTGSGYRPTYGLYFGQTGTFGTYGSVYADWATYFTMNSTAGRGWIFRQHDSPTNVAAISNAGQMTLASHLELGNNLGHPNVSWSASSTSTGMVIFYLPGTTANYGMVHMVFDIYEYNGNAASTVIVGGHNWSTSWYNTSASVVGQCGKEVRLGVKDGRFCVVFGTSGSSWEYGTIVLRKIHNGGFYDNIVNMTGNWSATQTTTESFTSISGDIRSLRTPASFEVGTIGYAYQSFRSPIFYDYDNTGYYVDPSSTSQLYQARFLNRIAVGNGSTPYLNTGTAGIWFSNSGNSSHFAGSHDSDNSWWGLYSNGAWRSWLTGAGSWISTGDQRAPIFYDYDNTGYFVNPASNSNLNTGTFNGRMKYSDYLVSNNNGGLMGDYSASGTTSKVIWTIGESWPLANMYGLGYEYGSGYDHHLALRNNGTTYSRFGFSGGAFIGGTGTAGSDFRAPIFYDSNDTGWYLDPASTSNLNRISTVRANNWLYLDNNYGHSIVGVYTSTRYQGVWAMGDSYKLAADGTTVGNLYGLAWSHPNTGGAAANLASHGLLLLEAGSFKGAWGGGSFRTPGDVRGTIFYDYDNTGYYLDPTSTTSLRTVGDWRADSASWTGEFSGKIQYHSSIWYFQAATGWQFRNSGGSQMMFCDSSGNVTFNGNVTAYSDRRLKENVRDLTGAQAYLNKISAKRFTWKDDGREDIGFIAQDVEAAGLTEFVLETADYDPNTESASNPFKTLDYGRMVSVLWQAVKEQNIQITAMSAEINSLKERLH